MKRWMVVALVAALAVVLAPAAVAGIGGSDGDRSQFMVEGQVVAVAPCDGGNLITMTVTTGTRDVKDYVDRGVITVKLPTGVAVVECVPPPGSVVIPLSKVTPGCTVMARGVIDTGSEATPFVAFRFQLMSYAAPVPAP